MAVRTMGTNSTTAIATALQWYPGGILPADLATFRNNIKHDQIVTSPSFGSMLEGAQLFIPARGVLRLLPGDWIGVDSAGWPILISQGSMAANWTHS